MASVLSTVTHAAMGAREWPGGFQSRLRNVYLMLAYVTMR